MPLANAIARSAIYSVYHSYEVHMIFSLFPLPFPSWEGLGVGSSSLLPAPCSLLPAPCTVM
ncbi:hypothetical protein [Moorena producens]|uniref:hypothetical protein n=1 Tax=Moorena producens TaxID=1155739 RepID=UPI003C7920FC